MNDRRRRSFRSSRGAILLFGGLAWGSGPAAARGPEADEPAAGVWVFPEDAFTQDAPSIQSGQRLTRDERGEWLAARQVFPLGGEPAGKALPARLGGGYLFFQPVQSSSESGTALWRSSTWTGRLEPVAFVPLIVERVEAGFDRIYLLGRGEIWGFDLERRRVTGLGALPRVPVIEGLSFSDEGAAVVQAPLVGVLGTVDGGLTYRPIPEATGVARGDDARVTTEGGSARLAPSGRLFPLSPWGTSARRDIDDAQRVEAESKRSAARVRAALLRGAPVGTKIALVEGSELVTLETARGVRLAREGLERDFGHCAAIGPGKEEAGALRASFFCVGASAGGAPESSWVELEGSAARVLAQVPGARRVRALGPARVLLEGACDAEARPGLCSFGPRGSASSPRVEALAWGLEGARVVGLFRAGKDGLVIREPGSSRARRRFELPQDEELAELFREGRWLDGLTRGAGGFSGWLVRGEEFLGVWLGDEGHLELGPRQRPVRRAVFAGGRALLWGAAGFAKETTDGGRSWRELALPFQSGDPDHNVPISSDEELGVGAGWAGVVLGRTWRIGWGRAEGAAQELAVVPERAPIPPPGGGRQRFRCVASEARARPSSGKEDSNFWGLQIPPPPQGQVSVITESVEELGRFVAEGPTSGSWAREGSARLYYRDPFGAPEVKASAPTRGLFPDALRAEEALGKLEPTTSTAQVALDANGGGGLFLSSGRARVELFAFAAGEPIERIAGADELGVRRLSGAARIQGRWYTAYRERDVFTVLAIEGGRLRELRSFGAGSSSTRVIDLVGSGGGLGIAIDGDAGLFVYPLSPSGELGEPLLAPHRGSRPETCGPFAQGYQVVRELGITPHLEADGRSLDVSRVSARLRVGPGWTCLEGLAGRIRTNLDAPRARPTPRAVPLTITDFSGGRSLQQLWCE